MLLYPMLVGWAILELQKKIKGVRLQGIKTSVSKKAVWLILSDKKGKQNLFFLLQTGKQIFYLAPVPQARNHPGWEDFAPSKGGEFVKAVRQRGGDSLVEIFFTDPEGPRENDFVLQFTLFGKNSRVELFQPSDSERPKGSWPATVPETGENKGVEPDFSLAEIEKSLGPAADRPLHEALPRAVKIPQFLSNVILHRAGIEVGTTFGNLSEKQKESLKKQIKSLLEKTDFQPTAVFENERIKGISPFEWSGYAKEQAGFESFIEAFSYAAAWDELKRFEKKLLAEKRELNERREKIERELKTFENPERLRQMGDLILAAKDKIAPHSTELTTENWYENPPIPVKISLDTTKTPRENAEACFSKYRKSERALELLPKRIAETEKEIKKADELLNRIVAPAGVDEKWKLVYELEVLYPPLAVAKKAKSKAKPQIGWTFWTKDGFKFRVGRSSEENDRLTMREARKEDMFLHASQSPGSHVILIAERRPFSKEAIQEAAAAAAFFSKARNSTKVNVDYAEARYVQKPRKAKPGLVVLMRSKSVMVYPKKPERREDWGE
jgi:predicted ribosome quality control (RQC) complex YloA/Tae2 family protein